MANPVEKKATYDELLALPENVVGEILDGVLYVQSRPSTLHAIASSALGGELNGAFHRGRGGPGGWVILDEPELHLHGDVLVPDIAGWRRTRMPEVPQAAAFELAPDWVCEVISPSTGALDRTVKRRIYAREKIEHLWLVEPTEKTLEVFRRTGDLWTLLLSACNDEKVRAEPFEAYELELGELWKR